MLHRVLAVEHRSDQLDKLFPGHRLQREDLVKIALRKDLNHFTFPLGNHDGELVFGTDRSVNRN